MGNGQPPIAVQLAEVARHRPLSIYAGAGLSQANPTNIPAGAQLAQLCHDRLSEFLGPGVFDCADPTSLTSISDAAAQNAGIDLVRLTAVAVADFTSARPNFSHRVLALLLLEGIVVAITTNWDNCIERAGGQECVFAIVSNQDRLELHNAALLKVHGCATRPTTLLITTQDLQTPPLWVRDEVNVRLLNSHIVFIGIGDVPPYVRTRIREATEAVGGGGAIFVVSPDIHENWGGSHWAEILPDLPDGRRIATTSDEFFDHFAAAYVRGTLRDTFEALSGAPLAAAAFNRSRRAFDAQTSVAALCWLRRCSVPSSPGASAMGEQAFSRALIALGRLAEPSEPVFLQCGRAIASDAEYEVLAAVGTVTATKFRLEAENRLVGYRSAGRPLADLPKFLIAGAVGRLDGVQELPTDVLDDFDPQDLIAGPLAVEPTFVHAEDYVP